MAIGLIDVDGHHFPNLTLMKLSAYYKAQGCDVKWYTDDKHFNAVFMSKVFSDTYSKDIPSPSNADIVIRGGTGYAITTENGKEVYHKELDPPLTDEIETMYPDYSLYPQYTGWEQPLKKQTAYGFLTRGCPRGCDFCIVAPKEGKCSRKVADLNQFWNGQGNISLSDPNILACPDALELLDQLKQSGAKVDFNQGLDARLITSEKAQLLAGMRMKEPHFAMDTMQSIKMVENGLRLYVEAYKEIHGKWNWRYAKVFCLVNFGTTFQEDMERVKLIQDCGYQPYVMIYNKPSAPKILRRLQRWTNNTQCYAITKDFFEYRAHTYKTVLYE